MSGLLKKLEKPELQWAFLYKRTTATSAIWIDKRHVDESGANRPNAVAIKLMEFEGKKYVSKKYLCTDGEWLRGREIALLSSLAGIYSLEKIGGFRQDNFSTPLPENDKKDVTIVSRELLTRDLGIDLSDWSSLFQNPANENINNPWKDARFHLAICSKILEKIHAFHINNYIHCDIKEDNLTLPFEIKPCSYLSKILNNGIKGKLNCNEVGIIDLGFSLAERISPPKIIIDGHPSIPPRYKEIGSAVLHRLKQTQDQAERPSDPHMYLDWRIDFFRLAHVIEKLFKDHQIEHTGIPKDCKSPGKQKEYINAKKYLLKLPNKLREIEENAYQTYCNFKKPTQGENPHDLNYEAAIKAWKVYKESPPDYKHLTFCNEINTLISPPQTWDITIPLPSKKVVAEMEANIEAIFSPCITSPESSEQDPPKVDTPYSKILLGGRAIKLIALFSTLLLTALALSQSAAINEMFDKLKPTPQPASALHKALQTLGNPTQPDAQALGQLSSAFKTLNSKALVQETEMVEQALKLVLRSKATPEQAQAIAPGLQHLSELEHPDAALLLGYYAACRLKPARTALARQGFSQRQRWEEKQGHAEAVANITSYIDRLDTHTPQLCEFLDSLYSNENSR